MSEVEDPGAAAIEKSTALPDREIICGEFAALSVSVNMPFELPTALGLKVTLMLHEADAASDDPQLFVCAKLLLAPAFRVATILVRLNAVSPVFVSETLCDWLVVPTRSVPKVRAD